MIFIYALLIILGFLPFFIILYKMNKVKRMKRTGVKVTGTVMELYGFSSKGLNSVLIEYPLEGTNQVIQKKIIVAGMPYAVGDKLPLYYDRNDPFKMLFDSGSGFIVLLIFTLLLAGVMIVACVWIEKNIPGGGL